MYGHTVIAIIMGVFAFADLIGIVAHDEPAQRFGALLGVGIYGYAAYLLW